MAKEKVLIVDDEEINLELISMLVTELGYEAILASNGEEAVKKCTEARPDLVILDIMMPFMDGYEVCRHIRGNVDTANIPVIMVSALHDRESMLMGLEAGADEFLSKPIDQSKWTLRVKNLLAVKAARDFMLTHNQRLEEEVRRRTLELDEAFREIKDISSEMVRKLTAAAELRDTDSGGHIARIGLYSRRLAEAMDLPPDFVEDIAYASPAHDVGMIGIPDRILLKTGPLTQEETGIMRSHTTIGERILSNSTYPVIQMAADIAWTHHEHWDGGGYPRGLRGKEIPLAGRIVLLADQYDALRSGRPFKIPFDSQKAFKILTEGDGRTMPGHFDPAVLKAFREIAPVLDKIFETS